MGDILPGNMNGILEDNSACINAIIIPDKVTYEKLDLMPEEKNIRSFFGYAYDFKENHGKPQCLYCNQFNQIERLKPW
ncbi:MAG: hypothetical protein ACLUMQ_02500 [Streptococcus salivarius]